MITSDSRWCENPISHLNCGGSLPRSQKFVAAGNPMVDSPVRHRYTLTTRKESLLARTVNRIRNPDFALGEDVPRHWTWHSTSAAARFGQAEGEIPASARGVGIRHLSPRGLSRLEQSLKCRPGKYYRVEADVSCVLETATDDAGLFLTLRTPDSTLDLRSAPIVQSSQPIAIRAYFEIPKPIQQVIVGVAVSAARGWARVHQVRFIPIIEPEEESHAMAIPPPAIADPAPRRVETICICSAASADRPLVDRLRAAWGTKQVSTQDARTKKVSSADVVLFPDDAPPAAVRTLKGLLELAQSKLVIISLPAFAALSRGVLSVRTIEQDDDPIHARVVFSNWATTGFALHDCFPHAWPGRVTGSFVQRQLRSSPAQKAFCTKHQLTVLLDSMCDSDATSHRPVCLFRAFDRGALIVCDMQPMEIVASTMNEPTITMQLLKSLLGRANPGLGQYTVPYRTGTQFRQMLRDFSDRAPAFVVHDDRDPQHDSDPVLVTIGGGDASFGLPLAPKPLVLIRSGLTSGEVESMYAALQWLKHLIRPLPHPCSYAEELCRRFRFAWIPYVAPWHVREGWSATRFEVDGLKGRGGRQTVSGCDALEMSLELTDAAMGAVIDVTTSPDQITRVMMPDSLGVHRRMIDWLPKLIPLALPAPVHAFLPSADGPSSNRGDDEWRVVSPSVEVSRNPSLFDNTLHRDAACAGAAMVRIELPRHDADFVTNSVHGTALGATLIEQVIGLVYGLIAVNRSANPVTIAGLPPLAAGQTCVLSATDPILAQSDRRSRNAGVLRR